MNPISGNKVIAKNSVYLYIRMAVVMIISLLSVRLVLKGLGVIDYGIYSAIGGLVVSFSFLSQTLVSASQRFFSIDIGLRDDIALKRTYNAILFSYLIIAVVVVILLETIGLWFVYNKMTIPEERIHIAHILYQFSILTFVVHILTNPFNALIIANEDMKTYAYISLVECTLKLFVAFSLKYILLDRLLCYSLMLSLVSILIFLLYFRVCHKRYNCVNFNIKFDLDKIKQVFSFSSWTIFGTLTGVVNNQGINVILNLFFGPVVNAAYSVSYQVSGLLSQMSNSFFSAVRPPLTKSYAIGKHEDTFRLFNLSTKVLLLLLSIIFVPLFVLLKDLIILWLGQIQPYMVEFSRLLLVYVFWLALSNPITTIAQAAGAVKLYHGIVDGFTLISLPLIYIAYRLGMPPNFGFFIIIVVFIIAHFIRLILLKKFMSYSIGEYCFKLIVPTIIILLIEILSSTLLYNAIESLIFRLILVSIFSVLTTLLSLAFILLDSKERKIVIDIIKTRKL